MSSTFDPTGSWERIAAELRAGKEAQQKAYGDVDSATLGRYLAGEMSQVERASLEQTLDELPELRKLTVLVQDVLAGIEPLEETVPAPVILPLRGETERMIHRQPAQRRRVPWLRRYAPLVAAACLLIAFVALMPRPAEQGAFAPNGLSLTKGVAGRSSPTMPELDNRMVFLEAPLPAAFLMPKEDEPPPGAARVMKAADAPATKFAFPANTAAQNPYSAAQLNQVVTFYHSQGEVAQAAKALNEAHLACKQQYGPQHKATQWTNRQLAGVYQLALNDHEEAIELAPVPSPDCPRTRARSTAKLVREQITRQPVPVVRLEVVPVLIDALNQAGNEEERLALTRALGELGPAARPAVPLLCKRLEASTDPSERHAILVALDRMGPAARDAVPTLTALVRADDAQVTDQKDLTRARWADRREIAARERELAKQVLARITGREARVGVFDSAGLFRLQQTIATTAKLRKLAREGEVEVRIETYGEQVKPATPSGPMGPMSVVVILGPKGKPIEVRVTDSLRKQGVDPTKLTELLSACSAKGDSNEVLATVLGMALDAKAKAKKE